MRQYYYKEGRFYAPGISFLIPNGFYTDDFIGDGDAMRFISPDEKISVFYRIESSSLEEAIELDEDDFIDSYISYEPAAPFQYNGLKGLYLFYAADVTRQYLNICFQAEEGNEKTGKEPRTLFIEIMATEDIRELIKAGFFNEILGSIRKENEPFPKEEEP